MKLTPEEQLRIRQLALYEAKKKYQDELPHLYAFKNYKWSQEYWESRNHIKLVTAANQIGKSSIQIRQSIDWATRPELWPSLWVRKPTQFWYLYPTKDVATLEFETKWKYLLPQGEMARHPQYGWEPIYYNRKIEGIRYNSGILQVFKSYAQDVQNLQSGTVDRLDLDEEAPSEIMGELFLRLAAANGYFSSVFTATQGQEYWRMAMEERGKYERFPNADKWQVSMYDCLKFVDGTDSHWTVERIEEIKRRCANDAEVQMRVYGKFVVAEGRTVGEFSLKEHLRPGGKIPKDWFLYSGVDYGSGGAQGHPASICFVAVKPDFTEGRVVRSWRGDFIQTDATDIVMKHRAMRTELQSLGLTFLSARYDFSCRDLFTIGNRMQEPMQPAEKSHSVGVPMMNSLFKNHMVFLDEEDEETHKLASELCNLKLDTPKTKAKDDLTDAFRYAIALIPWNWTIVNSKDRIPDTFEAPELPKTEAQLRREFMEKKVKEEPSIDEEFEEWNEAYSV